MRVIIERWIDGKREDGRENDRGDRSGRKEVFIQNTEIYKT